MQFVRILQLMTIQSHFNNARETQSPLLAVLIDPDKVDDIGNLAKNIVKSKVDIILVGGSLVLSDKLGTVIQKFKEITGLPIVIFPGNPSQVNPSADGILLLSLISGRNAEFLIGHHVNASVPLMNSGLEIMSTGYILVDGGNTTAVQYMSNTNPVPNNKPDIAMATALAGQQLGLKNIYLEAGSGATNSVDLKMIKKVKKVIDIPLIVGGGIRTPQQASEIAKAGADVIVVGTAFENDSALMGDIANAIHCSNA